MAVAFRADHPKALAMYCSDGRFTRAVEGLFTELGHERLDTMTLPGGPALLTLSALPSDRDSASRASRFLIQGHALSHVVLIAHEGCGYYRARHPTRAAEALRELQVGDLARAATVLRLEHPALDVQAFYARVVEGRIRFVRVDVTGRAASTRGSQGADA